MAAGSAAARSIGSAQRQARSGPGSRVGIECGHGGRVGAQATPVVGWTIPGGRAGHVSTAALGARCRCRPNDRTTASNRWGGTPEQMGRPAIIARLVERGLVTAE